jgi:hypothetical protein
MVDLILLFALVTLAAAIGALAGLLTAHRFLRRRLEPEGLAPEVDPYTSAQLDAAALRQAEAQGRPEAAVPISAKLHLLHRLATQRGWRT